MTSRKVIEGAAFPSSRVHRDEARNRPPASGANQPDRRQAGIGRSLEPRIGVSGAVSAPSIALAGRASPRSVRIDVPVEPSTR